MSVGMLLLYHKKKRILALFPSLSLSLSIYIYICVYIYLRVLLYLCWEGPRNGQGLDGQADRLASEPDSKPRERQARMNK
jgi:hypothetical protein